MDPAVGSLEGVLHVKQLEFFVRKPALYLWKWCWFSTQISRNAEVTQDFNSHFWGVAQLVLTFFGFQKKCLLIIDFLVFKARSISPSKSSHYQQTSQNAALIWPLLQHEWLMELLSSAFVVLRFLWRTIASIPASFQLEHTKEKGTWWLNCVRLCCCFCWHLYTFVWQRWRSYIPGCSWNYCT